MKLKAIHETMFSLYHGVVGDANNLCFMNQLLMGFGTFKALMVVEQFGVIQSMMSGAKQHSVNKVNPLLLPGAKSSVCVGDGPAVDIRKEHLEKASLNGSTLITGRTLLARAKDVHNAIKKADAVAKTSEKPKAKG